MILRTLLTAALACGASLAAAQSTFPSDWAYKQAITIPAAKIDADLTDFTVLVTRGMLDSDAVDPSGGASDTAQANGGDLRFSADAAGATRLPIDVMAFGHDTTTGAGDAAVLVAVKVPSLLAASGGEIYVWYGTALSDVQPAANATYGQYAAYDANWYLFSHDGGAADRTSHQLSGAISGTTPPTAGAAAGPAAGVPATDYPGVDEHAVYNSPAGLPSGAPLTLAAWANFDGTGAGRAVVDVTNSAVPEKAFSIFRNPSSDLTAFVRDGTASVQVAGPVGTTNATWYFAAARYSSTTSRYMTIDGAASAENTTSVTPNGLDRVDVGRLGDSTPSSYMDGRISLVSIHTVDRGAAWLRAAYENIHDAAAFGVAGSPIANSPGGGGATAAAIRNAHRFLFEVQ